MEVNMTDLSATPMIELQNVSKAFGKKEVLKGVSLTIPKGKSLVILGGSGSGKSVTLKSILGLIEPDSGSIKIDGEEVTGLTEKQREGFISKIGMLFQGGALLTLFPYGKMSHSVYYKIRKTHENKPKKWPLKFSVRLV